METIVEKMRVRLLHWRPEFKPFDHTVAAALLSAATDIERQTHRASGPARSAMQAWASALKKLCTAMGGKDSAAVETSAATVKNGFPRLKKVCNFQA